MSHTNILIAPIGKAGLQVAWCGDIYAIAADFSRASDPILSWSPRHNDWVSTGMQVADYRHSNRAALRREIEQAMSMSGDEIDEDYIESIMDDAAEVLSHETGEMLDMLRRHGEKFTGGECTAVDTSQGWVDAGFDAESADHWCAIGVWDYDVAAVLRDEGLTPDQVGRAALRMIADAGDCAGDEYTGADPIYSVCNYDTDIELLIEECAND